MPAPEPAFFYFNFRVPDPHPFSGNDHAPQLSSFGL
jgi:hypothetical protein